MTSITNPTLMNTQKDLKISAPISGIAYDWLNDSGFENEDNWELEVLPEQVYPDLNGSIKDDLANLEVLGYNSTKKIEDDLNDGTWYRFQDRTKNRD